MGYEQSPRTHCSFKLDMHSNPILRSGEGWGTNSRLARVVLEVGHAPEPDFEIGGGVGYEQSPCMHCSFKLDNFEVGERAGYLRPEMHPFLLVFRPRTFPQTLPPQSTCSPASASWISYKPAHQRIYRQIQPTIFESLDRWHKMNQNIQMVSNLRPFDM